MESHPAGNKKVWLSFQLGVIIEFLGVHARVNYFRFFLGPIPTVREQGKMASQLQDGIEEHKVVIACRKG